MNICIHLLELKAMPACACIADIRKFTSIKNGKPLIHFPDRAVAMYSKCYLNV
ncbi:hypothetical protein [Desulfosediminicola flagellatus]|uniref:hypothetical protein n=1 Tax=Desulfosediminicola flagellatus TaxID=2569541 RepID=UPI0012947C33|nr:hypothetical protein [Desulfosediminicola flagellatus]